MDSVTVAGQILSLDQLGYTTDEIIKQLGSKGIKVGKARVRATIRRAHSKAEDSRRIFEIWEMCLRIEAHLEELRLVPREKVEARMRAIESKELPARVGDRLDLQTRESLSK